MELQIEMAKAALVLRSRCVYSPHFVLYLFSNDYNTRIWAKAWKCAEQNLKYVLSC